MSKNAIRLFAALNRNIGINEELSYLVFEDLAVSGYATVKRHTGLDLEHYKHLMTKAAKLHAATADLVTKVGSI